jgi:hypothetical protein
MEIRIAPNETRAEQRTPRRPHELRNSTGRPLILGYVSGSVELAVREIESISGNQFRLGPEHELRFREFGGSGVASTQQ